MKTSKPCDAETAELRRRCHMQFDYLWSSKQVFASRKHAYLWLCLTMNLPADRCHIGMFDADQCRALLKHVKEVLQTNESVE
jgi:hypothetical protein